MSLDVYLEGTERRHVGGTGVWVRENGATRQLTTEEVIERYPKGDAFVVGDETEMYTLFSANIAHNLNTMADAAGLYQALWRPDENELDKAKQLIPILEVGLRRLLADRRMFETYNPENGWGDYDGLVEFVRAYLDACKQYPDAKVRVSR